MSDHVPVGGMVEWYDAHLAPAPHLLHEGVVSEETLRQTGSKPHGEIPNLIDLFAKGYIPGEHDE